MTEATFEETLLHVMFRSVTLVIFYFLCQAIEHANNNPNSIYKNMISLCHTQEVSRIKSIAKFQEQSNHVLSKLLNLCTK